MDIKGVLLLLLSILFSISLIIFAIITVLQFLDTKEILSKLKFNAQRHIYCCIYVLGIL